MEVAVARVCPLWLRDRSDDLVQVAMMRLLAIERKSSEKRELKPAYLRKVAYSAMVDEIRRQRRRQEVPLAEDDPERPWASLPSSDPDPEHQHVARQLGEGIRSCLALLIGPRQAAVTLYLQQHTVPESAKLLGWTPKRTENLVYRGLRDLRQCLGKKGIEP
jgi:RNA polymerase sigma-70 factor (ECF subfamily)